MPPCARCAGRPGCAVSLPCVCPTRTGAGGGSKVATADPRPHRTVGPLVPLVHRRLRVSVVGTPRLRQADGVTGLSAALTDLRDVVAGARFPLRLPDAQAARRSARAVVDQLDDYLLPRLVRAAVSPTSVLRPTTRGPVLVCHPEDAGWFTEARLLPHLLRTREATGDPGALRVVESTALTPGLALLDAPDIDSVVEANRSL